MKKIVKIFSILLAVFLLANCTEDIYLHDGNDGAVGPQGPKGDKGDSSQVELSFISIPASILECPSGGYKTEVYVNGILNATLPSICNGESFNLNDLKFKTDLFPLNESCKIRIVYVNNEELSRDTICNGESPDAYIPEFTSELIPLNELCKSRRVYVDGSLLFSDTICNGATPELSFVPVPATLEECPNGGYKTEIYVNGILNATLPAVCNGQDFNIEDLNLRTDLLPLDELCKIRVVYMNNEEFFRDTICNGESPEAYIPEFTSELIPLNELCNVRKVYLDNNLLFADTVCNGRDGEESQGSIVSVTLFWDFIGQSSKAVHVANGCIFRNSDVSSGNLYITNAGSFTTTILGDNLDLLSLSFLYGSATSRDIKVIGIMEDGSEEVIDEFRMNAIPNFAVNDYSKYLTYNYYADLDNIEFTNIVRIRIESSDRLKCVADDLLIRLITVVLDEKNIN